MGLNWTPSFQPGGWVLSERILFKFKLFFYLKIIVIFFSQISLASPTASSYEVQLIEVKSSDLLMFEGRPGSAAEVSLEQSQFLSEPTNTSTRSSLGTLSLKLKHESDGVFYKKASLNGDFAYSEDSNPYIAVPEIYIESQYAGPLFVNLGRKKRNWSQMDEQWDLGLWQALARWDYFKPESQGLIGLGAGAKTRQAGVEIFGSPLFVPDQGPHFDLVDGQFESENRWFWQPQTHVGVFSEQTDVRYKLFRPSEEEVILQTSLAARVWIGEAKKTPWMSAAYSYKPINQLHLAIDPNYQISTGQVEVAVYPEVVHHHIATLEGGLGSELLYSWFSLAREWPERPEYPESYLQSPLEENLWASASVGHRVGIRDFNMVWSYLKRWTLGDESKESLIGTSLESSYSRFPIEEAASVAWSGTLLRSKATILRWRSQYWYSLAENGAWFSSGLDWKVSSQSVWRLEVDVLGTSLDEDDTRGIISRYRSNDRVMGGFHYVF